MATEEWLEVGQQRSDRRARIPRPLLIGIAVLLILTARRKIRQAAA